MIKNSHVKLSSLIVALSSALDLVNQFVVNHHRLVANISAKLAVEIGLSDEEISDIAIASALHDLGAVTFNERFEMGFNASGLDKHAELGYLVLKDFKPFRRAATLVRHHHQRWDGGKGVEPAGQKVPIGSHIIHLADRAAVLLKKDGNVLSQADAICGRIKKEKNRLFMPDLVDAFLRLSEKEYFWLDSVHMPFDSLGMKDRAVQWDLELDLDMLLGLSELFRSIIDFRSTYTAAHSNSVARVSESLGKAVDFSEYECRMLRIAGNLHDLGKLAVPVEVLEKPGPLDREERLLVNTHTFHTYRLLDNIEGLDGINAWASFHHERLDGTGYPFHHDEKYLSLGSRIVAVADIFSALAEARSYRDGMPCRQVISIMNQKARERKIDPHIVSIVEKNYDEFEEIRREANELALREYRARAAAGR